MGSDISRPQQQNSFAKRRSSKRMSRRLSMGPPAPARGDEQKPPSIRVGGSTGKLAVEDNENEVQYTGSQSSRLSLSIDQLNTPRSRSGSSSSQSPTKPTTKHRSSLSLKNRQLIQSCFNNPHENIGCRILKRAAERRKDFGRFYMAVTVEQRDQIADTIKMLLKKSVACIDNADDELQILAIEFGQRFVDYRLHGFKADYFAALADATITECVLLDAAVHPAAVTLNAFSQFITMLFSSVRDGFYTEMRRLRRISNSFSTVSNGSVSRKKLSVEDALKSIERSPPISGSSGKSANSNTEIRRGSTGTVGNRSPNGSPRSLSPAEGKMSQSKSASPFEASSHDSEQLLVEQNSNSKKTGSGKKRGSKSPSPRRKISPGSASNSSYGGQKAKEELKQITAEFLNSGAIGTTFGGKENADEKPTRMAAAVAN